MTPVDRALLIASLCAVCSFAPSYFYEWATTRRRWGYAFFRSSYKFAGTLAAFDLLIATGQLS